MFRVVWVFGFILNGAPQIEKMPTPQQMELAECLGVIYQNTDRMADWLRGMLRQDLEFPVAVHGDCQPVLKDANRPEAATPRA